MSKSFGTKKVHRLTREEKIVKILEDKKAVNVEIINLSEKDYIVDFVVIATTLNSKHAFALLNHLKDELKPSGEEFLRVDDNEDWTVIDLGDAFIHLMNEKTRDKYSIEEFLSELETTKEG
jgi:ribosome-associated protein